jgi:glyoxalase/bleomycin resistance protein/dioxygenase superfamily protein
MPFELGTPSHFGLVVDDVASGCAALARDLGCAFTPVTITPIRMETPNGPAEVEFEWAYSVEQPSLELMGPHPGTIWTAGVGLHHVGYWSEDIVADAARLDALGLVREVTAYAEFGEGGQELLTGTYHRQPETGLLFELVNSAMRGPMLELFASVPTQSA